MRYRCATCKSEGSYEQREYLSEPESWNPNWPLGPEPEGSPVCDTPHCCGEPEPLPSWGRDQHLKAGVEEGGIGIGGAPTRPLTMPTDPGARKRRPIVSGVLDYFPDALLAVAELSLIGNEQHNPGQPLHWARGKSGDEADTLVRHLMERGTFDTDGVRHSAKAAWRALALLQKEIERSTPVSESGDEVEALEKQRYPLLEVGRRYRKPAKPRPSTPRL